MTTMRHTPLASLALALTLAPALGAQTGSTIARRVAAAPDGEVRLAYATRPDVCGDLIARCLLSFLPLIGMEALR